MRIRIHFKEKTGLSFFWILELIPGKRANTVNQLNVKSYLKVKK